MQVSVFLVFEFYRKGIPNGVQLTCQFLLIFYGPKEAPGAKELGQKSHGLSTRVVAAPTPLGMGPYLVDDLETPPDVKPTPKIPINTETPRKRPRSGIPPPLASVATKNQSGPCSGTLLEGDPITGGHLHHPGAIHDEEGVVHPRG